MSGFQVHFGASDVYTPGDSVDALVAMNPAALRVNLPDLKTGGILIVNADDFKDTDLKKAGLAASPLDDHSLDGYRVFAVELTKLTRTALAELGLDAKSMDRCKNFFALGMCYWLYNRSMDATHRWLDDKFRAKPVLAEANKRAMKAGYAYCDATEAFQVTYEVPPAKLAPGVYRNLSGNTALALGFVAAAQKAGLPLFLGSYPITPASRHPARAFDAEEVRRRHVPGRGRDRRDHVGDRRGLRRRTSRSPRPAARAWRSRPRRSASRRWSSCRSSSSTSSAAGRRRACRRRPSRPTSSRRSSAATPRRPCRCSRRSSPGDCFWVALEASRIAIKYMVPVIVLSDGYLANGAEPWRIPDVERAARDAVHFRTDPAGFQPYEREPCTLARPWAVPGTPGLEHRIGGLEKQDVTGNISYDPLNHEQMVHLRAQKVEAVVADVPDVVPAGDRDGRPADRRLGRDVRRHHRGSPRSTRRGAAASATCTCATSTRCRRTSATCSAATARCSSPS